MTLETEPFIYMFLGFFKMPENLVGKNGHLIQIPMDKLDITYNKGYYKQQSQAITRGVLGPIKIILIIIKIRAKNNRVPTNLVPGALIKSHRKQ